MLNNTKSWVYMFFESLACNRPQRTQGSLGPFGPGTPEESNKSPEKGPSDPGPPKSRKSPPRSLKRVRKESIYTEQMDAEGFNRKLLLTPPPPATPGNPRKADSGYLDSISQNVKPASTFEFSPCRHCQERPPGLRRGFWVSSGNLSPKTAASIYAL